MKGVEGMTAGTVPEKGEKEDEANEADGETEILGKEQEDVEVDNSAYDVDDKTVL